MLKWKRKKNRRLRSNKRNRDRGNSSLLRIKKIKSVIKDKINKGIEINLQISNSSNNQAILKSWQARNKPFNNKMILHLHLQKQIQTMKKEKRLISQMTIML